MGYCAWGNAVQTVVLNELSGTFGSLIQRPCLQAQKLVQGLGFRV